MKKFTVFTLILTIVIVVMAGQMIMEKYFPGLLNKMATENENSDFVFNLPNSLDLNETLQTDVLGSDVAESGSSGGDTGLTNRLGADVTYYEDTSLGTDLSGDLNYDEIPFGGSDSNDFMLGTDVTNSNLSDSTILGEQTGATDFEDSSNYTISPTTVYIREDQVKSAGFSTAYLEKEPHNGMLFKTILVDDLYDVDVSKYVVRTDETLLAKVYILVIGPNSSASEVYEVLKVRASEGLDIELNENNEFGDNSFFMNDARRQDTAFLAVKFGNLIYGFSYPKDYHAQIKNLISLIDMEF